jgi:hypothetical protein
VRFAGPSSGAIYLGEKSQLSIDGANRFGPKPYELDPDPNTREAIAYFTSSLDLNVGPRQAKSNIDDGSFGKMCRSVHEHTV